SDCRKFGYNYYRIEEVMNDYCRSFTRYYALSGLTTGMGGFAISVSFAGLDSITLAVQLYQLAQRFAILNGFDDSDPLQKGTILNIYFGPLGINAGIKATLKHHLLHADALADDGKASESLLLKVIIRAGESFEKKISSAEVSRLIPVIGGIEGAAINYILARQAGTKMKKNFKRAYFKTWQGEEI